MGKRHVPVGPPLGIATLGFGCVLGMLASFACSRTSGALYAALLVQTVTCVLFAGLWRFLARFPLGAALALEAAGAGAVWAGVLLALGRPFGPTLVPLALLWLVIVATLGTALRRARDRLHVLRAAALFLSMLAAGLCAGIAFGAFAEPPLPVETCLMVTLLLCALSVAVGARPHGEATPADEARDDGEAPADGAPWSMGVGAVPPVGPSDFDIACADLAEAFGLSAREREVFALLARGYRVPHIAQELCTAETTARTHVKHIYRKMSVRTADQIIQMVERRTAAVHAARCREYVERIRRIDLLLRLRGDARWPARRRKDR